MKVKVRCSKLECKLEDIRFKTQPGPVAKNATPRPPLLTPLGEQAYKRSLKAETTEDAGSTRNAG